MASFRAIQPAPSSTPRPPKRDKPSSSSGFATADSEGKRSKRFKSVTQACETCRHHKARCDGARPRCGGCEAKDRSCRYQGEHGQSRQAAMKTRFDAMVKLISDLQSKPQEEAEQLLARIRSEADRDAASFSGSSSEEGSSIAAGSSQPVSTESLMPTPASTASAPSMVSRSNTAPPTYITSQMLAPPPTTRLQTDPTVSLVPKLTRAAIQSFYSSSGKLFHVFSPEQIESYHKSVFGFDGHANSSRKLAICCLASVAAVGIQYNPIDFESGSDRMFYDLARHYFVDMAEERSPDAIKVCTMLAMYNILIKATSALGYVELGLGLSLTHSLNARFSYAVPPKGDDCWEDYRKTWRTLLFLASWLSSTLGYLSGNTDSAFQKLVPLAEVENDHACQIGEVVQAEMTRISLLKAEILRTHLSMKELTSTALDSALQALQDWYSNLAPQMRLSNLAGHDLPPIVRRSLFHVHLLYLGAHILLYRRIASQLIQLLQLGGKGGECVPWNPRQRALMTHAEKGITAAKHSARILGLLLAENGIFKRCWLVIFQSHTSCVVLLHSVAQKQIHNFPPSSWEEDLKQAQLCLDALEFCGKVDPVALRFHLRLSGIHHSLAEASPEGPTGIRRTEEWVSIPPDFPPLRTAAGEASLNHPQLPEYLVRVPAMANEKMRKLSHSLLNALCRPWGESIDQPSEDLGSERQLSVERVEGLRWDSNKSLPFSWDTAGLGVSNFSVESASWFMDSEEPSGWSPAPDVEVFEEDI